MLIGLCGKPHSGKSEVRYILENEFGFETVNTKLALAQACHNLTNVPLSRFLSQEGKQSLYKDVPLRKIMGNVQDAMEAMFGDYHSVEAALASIDTTTGNYVVDSLRKTQPLHFPGFVVEVVSPFSMDTGNTFDLYSDERIHFTLHNNGLSLDSLAKDIRGMLALMERTCPN